MPEFKNRPGAVTDAMYAVLAEYTADAPATAKTIHEAVIRRVGRLGANTIYNALQREAERGGVGIVESDDVKGVKRYFSQKAAKKTATVTRLETDDELRERAMRRAGVTEVSGARPTATVTPPNYPKAPETAPLQITIPQLFPPTQPSPRAEAIPQRVQLADGCGVYPAHIVGDMPSADGLEHYLIVDALERVETNGHGAYVASKRIRVYDKADVRRIRALLAAMSGEIPGAGAAAEVAELEATVARLTAELETVRRELAEERELRELAASSLADAERDRDEAKQRIAEMAEWRKRAEEIGIRFDGPKLAS